MNITQKRLEKITDVAAKRQLDLTIILENVHDTHNIGAVIRSCDSVGISEIFVLHNTPELVRDFLVIGKNSSSGTRKWVDVRFYDDTEACFKEVRSRYDKVFGTHLSKSAVDLYELDLSSSMALVFGNENAGITDQTLAHLDGNFMIPQVGMVQSLNISVACAVTLYEAFRQRKQKGMYDKEVIGTENEKLMQAYLERHSSKFKGRAHELRK